MCRTQSLLLGVWSVTSAKLGALPNLGAQTQLALPLSYIPYLALSSSQEDPFIFLHYLISQSVQNSEWEKGSYSSGFLRDSSRCHQEPKYGCSAIIRVLTMCPLVSQDGCHTCKYHIVTQLHPKQEGQGKGKKGCSFIREENIFQKPPVDSPLQPIGQNWVTCPLQTNEWPREMEVSWQCSWGHLRFVESPGTGDVALQQIQGWVSQREKGVGPE